MSFDPDLIRRAAEREGLAVFVPEGEVALPEVTSGPEAIVRPDVTAPDRGVEQHASVHVPTISGTERPQTALSDELERLIDEHVENIRHTLRDKAREAIEREVAALSAAIEGQLLYGHRSEVPEARMAADDWTPTTEQRWTVTPLAEVGTEAIPGTCIVHEGPGLLRCHHGISWRDGANAHLTGLPVEGFRCEECAGGGCAAVPAAGSARADSVGEASDPPGSGEAV